MRRTRGGLGRAQRWPDEAEVGGLGRGAAAARAEADEDGRAEADAGRLGRGPIRAATGRGRTPARRGAAVAGRIRRGGGGGRRIARRRRQLGDLSFARPNVDQIEGPFSFAS